MKKKLIIFGDTGFAEIAYLYFSNLGEFDVVGFAVEEKFRSKSHLFHKDIYDFDKIDKLVDPEDYYFFAAITYHQLNTLRARIVERAKLMGFKLASYISPDAFIGPEVSIGEHCFIFENNTIQPFVTVSDNTIIWSGNHIGHHSFIDKNCFISSHVVISGFCRIGRNSFLGVNSTISNNVIIGEDNWIGPSSNIQNNTEKNSIFYSPKAIKSTVPSKKFFKI